MSIDRHLEMYITLRESGKSALEAVTITEVTHGALGDLDYGRLILAIAAYEIDTAGTHPRLDVGYSNQIAPSSAPIASRIL